MPPETKEGNEYILKLHKRGLPIVLIGRKLDSVAIDCVTTDTYTGAIASVMHFAELGHARIAFIGGELKQHVAVGRYQGYLDGLQKQNVC